MLSNENTGQELVWPVFSLETTLYAAVPFTRETGHVLSNRLTLSI
jgi:hypothetical protein